MFGNFIEYVGILIYDSASLDLPCVHLQHGVESRNSCRGNYVHALEGEGKVNFWIGESNRKGSADEQRIEQRTIEKIRQSAPILVRPNAI